MSSVYLPSPEELELAHQKFLDHEPRDLFYRAARWLLKETGRGNNALTTAEVIALFLFMWNGAVYQRRPSKRREHLNALEKLLEKYGEILAFFKDRVICEMEEADYSTIKGLFMDFANSLGPVGTAKVLHILAPQFFPLWDNAIARAYGLRLRHQPRSDAQSYWKFMRVTQFQCRELSKKYGSRLPSFFRENPLKTLDEWNYAKFTKQWIC